MKSLLIALTMIFFYLSPANACENNQQCDIKKVRTERPLSLGASLGLMPFLSLYGDYSINPQISVGANLSTAIIFNSLSGHFRYYFINPKSSESDYYTETRFGAGPGLFYPSGLYLNQNYSFQAMQAAGIELRKKNGFVFNGLFGINTIIRPDLSGMGNIIVELSFGYGF